MPPSAPPRPPTAPSPPGQNRPKHPTPPRLPPEPSQNEVPPEEPHPFEMAIDILVLVEAVPGLEETARACEPLLAEGLLGGVSFRVTTEISLEMTPARLAAGGVDVVVGPPAVGAADAGELVAEQFLEAVAVAVLGDAEDRRLGGGRGPEGAAFAGGRPAGLVDVDRRRLKDRGAQCFVRLCERVCSAPADRVDRPDRQPDPEQLPREL